MTTSLLAAVSSVLALGLLLWVLRLRKTLRREREENQRLRRLLRVGSQAASTDLAQMKKLRHDLRQYLTLAEASAVLRDAPDPAPPVGELESWAVSALKRHYLERAKVLGFQADLQITLPQTWEDAIPDVCLVLTICWKMRLRPSSGRAAAGCGPEASLHPATFPLWWGTPAPNRSGRLEGAISPAKPPDASALAWRPFRRSQSAMAAWRSSPLKMGHFAPLSSCYVRSWSARG